MLRCLKLIGVTIPLFFYQPVLHSSPQNNLKFEYLSVKDGLSSFQIYCIFQDRQGFLWFGTEGGLNKYDGYNIRVYGYDLKDSTSVSHNVITAMAEDQSGILWIATGYAGINKFDRNTETFARFRHDPVNQNSLSNDLVTCMYVDRFGTLWIGTRLGGLNQLIGGTAEENKTQVLNFKHFMNDPQNETSISHNHIETIYEDKSGVLWIGTMDGLNRFDRKRERFIRYIPDPENSIDPDSNDIIAIFEDNCGTLWIGTSGGGLFIFDRETNQFIPPISHFPKHVTSIIEDPTGFLWIGTYHDEGLCALNLRTYEFSQYKHNQNDPYSLSDNFIDALYVDRAGILWIATRNGGANKLDLKRQKFQHLYYVPNNPYGLSSNFLWSIMEDRSGKIWIGTLNTGVDLFDSETGKIKNYAILSESSESALWQGTRAIYEDKSGSIWFGTAGGLCILDKRKQKIEHYKKYLKYPSNVQFISHPIRSIFEDRLGILWIGTENGLIKFDRASERFTHYRCDPNDLNTLGGNIIHCIYEDGDGNLWIGNGGLNKFDRQKEKFKRYQSDPKNPNSISESYVGSIHEDQAGNLWLCSVNGGLNKFDKRTEIFTNYSTRDGLPSNCVYCTLEDHAGNLWISTTRGISKFNPFKGTFQNFDTRDGAQSDEFNAGAHYKGRSGRFYLGGINGLNIFYPDSIKANHHQPPVHIVDFKVFNKSIEMGPQIELSYKDYVFTFEFVALDYSIPEKNQYAYMMAGVDPDWVYTDAARRFATYTNLDPGEYVFRVKASNNDGVWNEEGTSIKIIITPPWWETGWAYALYALILGSIVVGFWRFQVRRIQIRNELKMKSFETQKLHEIDSMKSRFFANISHEFRTPLTLILGPISKMFEKARDQETKQELNMMQRNARRLQRLINQLLDLSKIEAGKMTLQTKPENIMVLLNRIVQSFESQAKLKGIELKFHSELDEIIAFIDRDKIENIFYNLLSNALKFTTEDGSVDVNVNIPPGPPSKGGIEKSPFEGGFRGMLSYIQITISDTGIGIPPNRLDKIFNRFYQVDDSHTREHEGSGIGLALTKELVDLHHGKIDVQSEQNKGTTFIVYLPLGKAHLKPEEIADKSASAHSEPSGGFPEEPSEDSEPSEGFVPPSHRKALPLVLIVEDNRDMRSYMQDCLASDYRVIEAIDGEDGLHRAIDKIPDLIISDVMMPKMDGFKLCGRLKSDERTSHIPVILLTARASAESKIKGLELGADDYLIKPFDRTELLVRVKNLIEQRRKLRERFSRDISLQPKEIAVTSYDEKFLQRTMDIIEQHLADSEFTVDSLLKEVGMSRMQLHRKLRALINCSASEFIRVLRLKRAAQLLQQKSGNVTEIAFEVGFNNLSYFSRCFRQQFGKLPSEYTPMKH